MIRTRILGHSDIVSFTLKKEKHLIDLMRGKNKGESLKEISNLNCSIITELLAYYFSTESTGISNLFAFYGYGEGLTEADSHQILGLQTNSGISAVDGTIWQVWPESSHVGIFGPFSDESHARRSLALIYGGEWYIHSTSDFLLTREGAKHNFMLLDLKAEGRNLPQGNFYRR